jgi:hypothetical protein
MSNTKIFFAIFSCIIFCGVLYYLAASCSPKTEQTTNEDIEKKIELLEKKIDSLSLKRDSIQSVIDTSKVKIVEIHEEYNKIRTNIIYQSVDSDYIQFAKYCADNKRLLDINNTSGVENN